MSDSVRILCPHCHHELKVRADYVGKKGQCKFCGTTFRLERPDPNAPPSERPAPIPPEVATLQRLLAEGKAEADRLHKELGRLRHVESERDFARNEVEHLRLEIDNLRRERDEALSDAKAEKASLERDWSRRRQELDDEIRSLGDEVSALTRQVAEAASSAEGKDLALARVRDEHASLRAQLEQQSQRLDESRKEGSRLEGECQRLRIDATRLDSALRDARDQHQAEVDRLKRELESLRERVESAEGDAKRVASLEVELDETRLRLDRAEAAHAEEGPSDLATRLEEAEAERSRLEGQLAEARDKIDRLDDDLRDASVFRDQMREFLGGLGIKLPN